MHKNRHLASIIAALIVAAASSASAQEEGDQDARHHFRLGSAHYESGHFEEAAAEFEQSYRLSNRAALLHNIYVAHRDAGNPIPAANALERYLAETPDVPNRQILEQRLAGLRRMAANGERSDGSAADSPDVDSGPEGAGSGGASTASDTRAAPEQTSGGGGGPSPVGFIVAGIGGAALIAGAVTGGLAISTQSELESNCPDGVCPASYDYQGPADSGRTLAVLTDVLIPVGAVAVAAGVLLILLLQDGPADAQVGAACTSDGCVGVVGGAF